MTAPALDTPDALWQQARAEPEFWNAHYPELRSSYPDQFVAVQAGQVVAAAGDLCQLVQNLEAAGIDPRDTWVRFLSATPRILVL